MMVSCALPCSLKARPQFLAHFVFFHKHNQPELNSQPREDLSLVQQEKNLTVIHPHFLGTVFLNL